MNFTNEIIEISDEESIISLFSISSEEHLHEIEKPSEEIIIYGTGSDICLLDCAQQMLTETDIELSRNINVNSLIIPQINLMENDLNLDSIMDPALIDLIFHNDDLLLAELNYLEADMLMENVISPFLGEILTDIENKINV